MLDANINNKVKPARKIRIRGRQVDNQSMTIGKENSSAVESIQMVSGEPRGVLSREHPMQEEEAKPNQFNVDLHVQRFLSPQHQQSRNQNKIDLSNLKIIRPPDVFSERLTPETQIGPAATPSVASPIEGSRMIFSGGE